jgi:nucleoside phosphorylase
MDKNPVTAIIMATMLEAKPFVQGLALEQSTTKPFFIFKNDRIRLIIAGIGKTNAAAATAYSSEKFNPVCICNLGAAGATDFSHGLGDIFHITKIFEYDSPEFESKEPGVHQPHILKGFKTATLTTSDKAVLDPEQRQKISTNAGLVDMEGAAVAQVCRRLQKKCIMFKFVSDTPKHTSDEDIVENIRLYRTPFFEFFRSSVIPVLPP